MAGHDTYRPPFDGLAPPAAADLDPPDGDARQHPDGEDLNPEGAPRYVRHQPERRHAEHDEEADQSLCCAPREGGELQDLREVDGHRHEEEPGQRGRRPHLCDEEVLPARNRVVHRQVIPPLASTTCP